MLVATGPAAVAEPLSGGSVGAAARWFTATAALLCGLAPGLLVASTTTGPGTSRVWPLALLLSVAVGLRYAWIVGLGERRLFETTFWLFVYVFLGLAPLVQLRTGSYPSTTPDTDPALSGPALLIVAVGVAAFAVGLRITGSTGRALRMSRGSRPAQGQAVRGRRTSTVSSVSPTRVKVLTLLSTAYSAAYVVLLGPGTFFLSREGRTQVEVALIGDDTLIAIVKASATLPLVVCFAALAQLRVQRREKGRHLSALPSLVVLGLLVVVSNPISTPRYFAGTAALTVACALGAVSSVLRTRVFALGLAVGLVLVFPYAAVARNVTANEDGRSGPVQTLTTPDFDSFQQINNTVAYVRDNGTDLPQLWGSALFFVPRSLWAGKPVDTGPLLADYRDYQVLNLSAPLWTEFFVGGGWPVLVLGMTALGAFVRRSDLRGMATTRLYGRPGVLGLCLPFYLILVYRGSLLQSMAGLAVLVVVSLFCSTNRPVGTIPDP